MDLQTFKELNWLHSLWEPVNQENVILVTTPDEFFEEIYQSPYEDWCVEDHNQAERLEERYKAELKAVVENVYMTAWSKYPHPEFCGLLYDDVETIAALLIINSGRLRDFTFERANWYARGRFPCGYKGDFPDGQWMIA